MKPQAVVNHYGSQVALADKLGVTKASVCKWVRAGRFPKRREYEIERISKGRFKAKLNTAYRAAGSTA